jgi:hypothetical protein
MPPQGVRVHMPVSVRHVVVRHVVGFASFLHGASGSSG